MYVHYFMYINRVCRHRVCDPRGREPRGGHCGFPGGGGDGDIPKLSTLGKRSDSGGGAVGDEEWLGRRSGQRGGVVGEEEWLGRTHAFTHVLHAVLARTHARPSFTHAFITHVRTHVKLACRSFVHARLARTHALHALMPSRMSCMYARLTCIPCIHALRVSPANQRVLKHGTVTRNHVL